MRVIFYAGEKYPKRAEYVTAICETIVDLPLDLCRNQMELAASLDRPWNGNVVAIILITDGNELKTIAEEHLILTELPLILVLPDYDHETVWLGHRLRPRFLSFLGNDFSDVTTVLKRLLARIAEDRQPPFPVNQAIVNTPARKI